MDILQQPPRPSCPSAAQFKRKRLLGCIEHISYLLLRHIEKSRSDMWEWLNMMEMLNYPVLKREASREYRLYQVWTYEKTDIDEIMDVLLEHGVLDKSRTLFQYQEWFAQKAMVILENIRDMHKEHSAVRGSFAIPSSVS